MIRGLVPVEFRIRAAEGNRPPTPQCIFYENPAESSIFLLPCSEFRLGSALGGETFRKNLFLSREVRGIVKKDSCVRNSLAAALINYS